MTSLHDPQVLRERLGPLVEREGGAPEGWAERLSSYLDLLVDANARVNLVSRKTVDRVVELQLLPSLAALLVVPAGSRARVLDVGSGGGFPGIPLRVLRPDIGLDLVEATRKKCEFLERCVSALGWDDVPVHWCRVEEPTPGLRERAPFDLGLSRAAGGGAALRRATCRLLRPAATLWIYERPETGGGEVFRDASGSVLTSLLPVTCGGSASA